MELLSEDLSGVYAGAFGVSASIWVALSRIYHSKHPILYVGHSILACVFALLSLWWTYTTGAVDETTYMREKALACFSAGYFVVDLVYLMMRSSYLFVLHHAIAIALIYGAVTTVEFQRAQCTSLILLTELSTPLLWVWERYRTTATRVLFLAVFFVARPLLLTYVLYSAFFEPDFLRIPAGPFHAILSFLNVLNLGYFVQEMKDFVGKSGSKKTKAS